MKLLLEITPDDPPNVTNLTYPFNATTLTSVPIQFNFTVSDDWNITNCSLYANFNTSWVRNLTDYPDTNAEKQYNFTLSPSDGTYKWNVLCYDNSTAVQKDWYESNFTITINRPDPATAVQDAKGSANNARLAGITIYAIGFGADVAQTDLMDIAKEEKTHVGEFQELLKKLDKEYVRELEAGKKEVEEKIE